MIIETERLTLRPVELSDADNIKTNINNINISRYLTVVPFPYTDSDATWWVNNCVSGRDSSEKITFALLVKPSIEVVGHVSFYAINLINQTAEIGYWLGESYWRNGYISEAVRAILPYGFQELDLRRLTIRVFAENQASAMLAEKLGFKFEGLLRQAVRCRATSKIHDEKIYGLLREEWLDSSKTNL